MVLAKRVDDRPRNQAEAPRAPFRIGRDGESPNEAVEHRHRPRPQRAVVAAGPGAPDDMEAGAPAVHEIANERRRILKVGRHNHGALTSCFAATVIDARGDRDMAAEIARKSQRQHPIVVGAKRVQHVERPVPAAVVDEHEFPVIVGQRAHDVGHRFMKPPEVVALVEDRHDNRDERSCHVERVRNPTTASMMRT